MCCQLFMGLTKKVIVSPTGLYSILAGLLEHSIEYLIITRFVKSPKLNLSTFQVLFNGYQILNFISLSMLPLLPNSDIEKESVCDRFQVTC